MPASTSCRCAVIDDEICCVTGHAAAAPTEPPFCADADQKTRLELLDMVPRVTTINPPDNSGRRFATDGLGCRG